MKSGFTMSEVLITIGIIGIIAAMTFPFLIQGYRKSVTETELRKAISMLNQAILLSSVKNDSPENWAIENGAQDTFKMYIAPYLEVEHECELQLIDNPKDICNNTLYNSKGTKIKNDGNQRNKKYILKNGIAFSFDSGSTIGTTQRRGVFYIYLETGASRYILGKNVFTVNLIVNDFKKYIVTGTMDYSPNKTFCSGMKSRTQMIELCENGSSNTAGGGEGYTKAITCTAMIECNNYKIPKDYPIKF